MDYRERIKYTVAQFLPVTSRLMIATMRPMWHVSQELERLSVKDESRHWEVVVDL